MFEDILIPLGVVGLAELGDKTQLSVLLLASKTKRHIQLLFGIILAFFVVDGIAILAGGWITNIVPAYLIKILSGIAFIALGIYILLSKREETGSKYYSKNPFLMGFTLIFLSEWGDKTQIASVLFATKYDIVMVLAGVMVALTLISIMAILIGKFISTRIKERTMTKIAGTLFIVMGIIFLVI